MVGQAYINNYDIWTTYGAMLIRGAYEALLTPAPVKAYVTNDSRNQHGTRYIANSTNTKIQSREIVINVLVEGTSESDYLTKYEAFLTAITSGTFALKVPKLNRIFNLVYSSCSKYGDYGRKKGIFALRLVEPNPKDRTTIN